MAIEFTVTEEITEAVEEYNKSNNWIRIYLNTDNGFIWWEDEITCPKANHITYAKNPAIKVLFEKGNKDGNNSEETTLDADKIIAKAKTMI